LVDTVDGADDDVSDDCGDWGDCGEPADDDVIELESDELVTDDESDRFCSLSASFVSS